MKIKYTGDGTITLREVDFTSGKTVEIKDPEFIQKLLALDTFEEVKPRKVAKEEAQHKKVAKND